MDEDDFYDRVMAVIIKLTSKSMPKEKLQIQKRFIKFSIKNKLFERKEPEFFIIHKGQGLVQKQHKFVEDLRIEVQQEFEDAKDFLDVDDSYQILFNLRQIALSRQRHEREIAKRLALAKGNSSFRLGKFVAYLDPVYLDQSHQLSNMQIKPEKKSDSHDLVLMWMDRQETIHADLLCKQLKIRITKLKKRSFYAVVKYLHLQIKNVKSMTDTIAYRHKLKTFEILKQQWIKGRLGRSLRMKRCKKLMLMSLGKWYEQFMLRRSQKLKVEGYSTTILWQIVKLQKEKKPLNRANGYGFMLNRFSNRFGGMIDYEEEEYTSENWPVHLIVNGGLNMSNRFGGMILDDEETIPSETCKSCLIEVPKDSQYNSCMRFHKCTCIKQRSEPEPPRIFC